MKFPFLNCLNQSWTLDTSAHKYVGLEYENSLGISTFILNGFFSGGGDEGDILGVRSIGKMACNTTANTITIFFFREVP